MKSYDDVFAWDFVFTFNGEEFTFDEFQTDLFEKLESKNFDEFTFIGVKDDKEYIWYIGMGYEISYSRGGSDFKTHFNITPLDPTKLDSAVIVEKARRSFVCHAFTLTNR